MLYNYYATGKRKNAIARVWLKPGEGKIIVNGRELIDYFKSEVLEMNAQLPLKITSLRKSFDVMTTVKGGGLSGQSDAVRHGISKALLEVDPTHRITLKKAGFITRDPRVKERKKPGQPGARKKFQFSKR